MQAALALRVAGSLQILLLLLTTEKHDLLPTVWNGERVPTRPQTALQETVPSLLESFDAPLLEQIDALMKTLQGARNLTGVAHTDMPTDHLSNHFPGSFQDLNIPSSWSLLS